MTVLLDTNVGSEVLRKVPNPVVEARAANHALEGLFFFGVGEAELRYNAAMLPTGWCRRMLVSGIDALFRDAGWEQTGSLSFPFEHELSDYTQSVYFFRNRYGLPVALFEAERAGPDPIASKSQSLYYTEQFGMSLAFSSNVKLLGGTMIRCLSSNGIVLRRERLLGRKIRHTEPSKLWKFGHGEYR